MRFLYLDDSGKPHPGHPSRCLVFGGFSIDESNWHAFVRQLSGAKAAHFPKRGRPSDWELKSKDFTSQNSWKRATNRAFCMEMADILRRNKCSVYVVYLHKQNASKPLHESWVVPRCFQVLATKFACELAAESTTGAMVCDWSTHDVDQHVSNCVQSFVLTKGITSIVGGVSYGSSSSLVPVQVADIIASTFRRFHEGQSPYIEPLVEEFRGLVWNRVGLKDVDGFPARTELCLF